MSQFNILIVLYAFLVAVGMLAIAVVLTFLDGVLQGAFIGVWFVVIFYMGYMYWRQTRATRITADVEQQQFRERMASITNNTRAARRRRRRNARV